MKLRLIDDLDAVPPEHVTAVFMVAVEAGQILAVQNERGWDIPGGYLEPGETADEALTRELIEEAGATVERSIPFATLQEAGAEKVMLLYVGTGITLDEWVQKPDALARQLMDVETFLGHYYGDQRLMRELIDDARRRAEIARYV